MRTVPRLIAAALLCLAGCALTDDDQAPAEDDDAGDGDEDECPPCAHCVVEPDCGDNQPLTAPEGGEVVVSRTTAFVGGTPTVTTSAAALTFTGQEPETRSIGGPTIEGTSCWETPPEAWPLVAPAIDASRDYLDTGDALVLAGGDGELVLEETSVGHYAGEAALEGGETFALDLAASDELAALELVNGTSATGQDLSMLAPTLVVPPALVDVAPPLEAGLALSRADGTSLELVDPAPDGALPTVLLVDFYDLDGVLRLSCLDELGTGTVTVPPVAAALLPDAGRLELARMAWASWLRLGEARGRVDLIGRQVIATDFAVTP